MRDGEQAGHTMSISTKVSIAKWLERLRVDVIEAGFPISSPAEITALREISKAISEPIICALAGVKQDHIEAAARSLELAKKSRIHVFVSTSDIHIRKKLRSTREEVLEAIYREVSRAKGYCEDVEFSAEDATRTNPKYLIKVIETAIDAGATTINIPDTVGYAQVDSYGELIDTVWKCIPDNEKIILSVHCHDDLGLAVANSLNGVLYGADQVEGCFLGIGERAGNAALEDVIMALHTRYDLYDVKTNIDISQLGPFFRFLSSAIGYPISDHKSIAGRYAFTHSSGIHADGVLKDRQTYEIMKPEDINWQGAGVALVSHLGEAGLADHLKKMGYSDPTLASGILGEFKLLANSVGRLSDEDLHMLIQEHLSKEEVKDRELFTFGQETISFESENGENKGSILILKNSVIQRASALGDGPVDAVCKAIDKALSAHGQEMDKKEVCFNFIHGSGGSEALGFARARVKLGDQVGYGRASSLNIVVAYAQAYLDAINHLIQVPVSEEKENLRKVFI